MVHVEKSNETDPLKVFTKHFTTKNLLCTFENGSIFKRNVKILDLALLSPQAILIIIVDL